MSRSLAVILMVLLCVMGFAMPPDDIAFGVLMFLLGYNAQYVLALAWRAHRAKTRTPRGGALVYLCPPHRPQAVRKEQME